MQNVEASPLRDRFSLKEGILVFAVVALFLFWLSRYINADFWYDEVLTLTDYVFAPLGRAATSYSLPNNHVFFSLVSNVYAKLVGIRNLYFLLDHPWMIRCLPLAFTLVTLVYLYLIGRRFFNRFVAITALVVLTTTIPYYNFALQIRGFGLSMMLLCMLLYYSWSYERNPSWVRGGLVALLTALSLYTIPLNLYFIMVLAGFYLVLGILKAVRNRAAAGPGNRQDFLARNRLFVLVMLIIVGTGLAALLYLPVINDVLHNRFVQSHGLFYLLTLAKTMPLVLHYFISARYLLILLAILGIVLYISSRRNRNPELSRKAMLCAALLLMPFVLSFIRGDHPSLRVFVNLAPVFALLVSICLYFLWSRIQFLRSRPLLTILLMLAYCGVTFAFGLNHVRTRLRLDIETGRKTQNILYNCYQAYYHPLELVADFARNHHNPLVPLVIYDVDQAAMPQYLDKFGISHQDARALEPMLHTSDRLFVITALPNRFEAMIGRGYPGFQYRRLNDRLSYHNIFLLTRKKAHE